jgi:hypothetical protein
MHSVTHLISHDVCGRGDDDEPPHLGKRFLGGRRRWWLVSVLCAAQTLVWTVCIYIHTRLGRMDEMARLS